VGLLIRSGIENHWAFGGTVTRLESGLR